MTNAQIISLLNAGILNITAHDLEAKQAYQVLLFRRALQKAANEIEEKQKAIVGDPKASELMAEFGKEEVTLPQFEPLTFEQYHTLARENRAVPTVLLGKDGAPLLADPLAFGEDILEGILWKP